MVFASSGRNAFPFLRISPDARASALAEAVVADAEGAGVLYFNPAGLPHVGPELQAQHLSYVSGISYDTAEYAQGSGSHGWGMNAGYLSYGDFTRTVYDATSVDRFDETGKISAHDLLLSGGYGYSPNQSWSVGVAAKVFQETLDNKTVNGIGLDVGALVPLEEHWTAGMVFRHLGPSLTFSGAAARLPWTADAGVWNLLYPWLHWGAELSETIDEPVDFKVGAEVIPYQQVFLRGGYKVRSESNDLGIFSGVTVGGGFRVGSAQLDYAFGSLGDFGGIHRFSLSWYFRESSPK